MKKILLFSLISFFFNAVYGQKLNYPSTEKINVKDTYFNDYSITDEYRWLEDIKSLKTQKWITEQTALSEPFLKKLQNRHNSFITIDKFAY